MLGKGRPGTTPQIGTAGQHAQAAARHIGDDAALPADDGRPGSIGQGQMRQRKAQTAAMRGTLLQNGRNPDIVPAYLFNAGITLITEACREKSNEITAIPQLLDKLDIAGDVVTADAISMQKEIIDKIREKNGDFVIELKANRRSLRYVIEERIKTRRPCKLTRKMHFLSTAGLR